MGGIFSDVLKHWFPVGDKKKKYKGYAPTPKATRSRRKAQLKAAATSTSKLTWGDFSDVLKHWFPAGGKEVFGFYFLFLAYI